MIFHYLLWKHKRVQYCDFPKYQLFAYSNHEIIFVLSIIVKYQSHFIVSNMSLTLKLGILLKISQVKKNHRYNTLLFQKILITIFQYQTHTLFQVFFCVSSIFIDNCESSSVLPVSFFELCMPFMIILTVAVTFPMSYPHQWYGDSKSYCNAPLGM